MPSLSAEALPAAPAPRVSLGLISMAPLSLLAEEPRGTVSHVQSVATFTQEQNTEAKLWWREKIMFNNMQINVASHKDLICVSRQLLKLLF